MSEIRPSRIQVKLEELSTKQRNIILSVIKDIEFTPMEISELVIKISDEEISGGTKEISNE